MRLRARGLRNVMAADVYVAHAGGASFGAEKQALEGRQICIDIINEVKEIEGVSGIHVMAYRQEETVAEIVHRSALFPRTRVRRKGRVAEEHSLKGAASAPK